MFYQWVHHPATTYEVFCTDLKTGIGNEYTYVAWLFYPMVNALRFVSDIIEPSEDYEKMNDLGFHWFNERMIKDLFEERFSNYDR